MKNRRILADIYCSFYLNRLSIGIIIVFLLLMTICFMSSVSFGISEKSYLLYKDNIINSYFNESFFAISLVNGVFAIFIGSLEFTSGVGRFDVLFIASQKRNSIYNAKILAHTLVLVLFYVIEFLLLFLIPTICYEDFSFKIQYLFILSNLVLNGIFIYFFAFIMANLLNNNFSMLLCLVIFFVMKLLCESDDDSIKQICGMLFPMITIDVNLKSGFYFSSLYVINLCVVEYILSGYLFRKKNY